MGLKVNKATLNYDGDTMKKLMQELERVRLALDFTQAEMGKVLNIRRENYTHWKQGDRYPDTNSLVKIYTFFRIVNEKYDDIKIWDEGWTTDRMMRLVEEDTEEIEAEKREKVEEMLSAQSKQ